MATTWIGIDTDEKLVIASAVGSTIAAFVALGPSAQRSCEDRRVWLLGQLAAAAAWIPPCLAQMAMTPEAAATELAPAFVPFAFPANLTVAFAAAPQLPNCAMTHQAGTISVFADLINATTLSVTNIHMTVEQATLHELIHACGDVNNDTDVRMNWAGVGALFRAVRNMSVTADDGLPVRGA